MLKVLQRSYYGQVKCIYIDPPYNTGNDAFIYPDRFDESTDEYLARTGDAEADGTLRRWRTNTRTEGRFHSNWLSMMLPRLGLARNLLRADGVIFVSIDDNEVHNLRLVMDEVFGEENFIEMFSWVKSETPANLSRKSKKMVEYVLCYQRVKDESKFEGVRKNSPSSNGLLNQSNKENSLTFPANIVSTRIPDGKIEAGMFGTDSYDVELLEATEVKAGVFVKPVKLRAKFKWSQKNLEVEINSGTSISIPTIKFSPSYERVEYDAEVPPNLINSKVGVDTNEKAGKSLEELLGGTYFDFPKPVSLIKYLVKFSDKPDGIILDFFAGSGTTGQAVLELNADDGGNRQCILVQLPEKTDEGSEAYKAGFRSIADLTAERLRRVLDKLDAVPESPVASPKDETQGRIFIETSPKAEGDESEQAERRPQAFTHYRLAPSNFKTWRGDVTPEALADQLDLFVQPEKPGSTEANMLTEFLLKQGYPLTVPRRTLTLGGTPLGGIRVESVNDGELLVCLHGFSEALVDKLLALKPKTIIVRDALFQHNDALKTNTQLQVQDAGLRFFSV